MTSTGEDEKPKSKRVFINNVDSYQANNIGKYLSRVIPGASLEDADDEDEADQDGQADGAPKDGTFEIIATMKNKNSQKPDFVKEILQYDSKEDLYQHIVECDVIIYDITEDPEQIDKAVWIISEMNADLMRIDKQKIFILISTVMTWAKSKPLDPEDPDIPFTEDDYRRRKPHPNFKEHIAAEKTIMKLGKTSKGKLQIYVVATGLTYGAGENIFHYMFKSAWQNAEHLQAFGNGQNIIPTIHIHDLAAVLQNVIDSKPKVKYLIAVDDSNHALDEIVKSVATQLGSGKIKYITKEEALLSKNIVQADFDMLLVNLRMDAIYVRENMHIRWVAEQGMVENIDVIVNQYKETRQLMPLRVLVVGPPGVGKSTVVRQLCSHYKLHHVHAKDMLAEALDALQRRIARAEAGPEAGPEGEGEAEAEEEDEGRAQEDAELMEAVNDSREENGRMTDTLFVRFMRDKLRSKPCQNQGFILDGFPKTMENATDTFAVDEDDEGEDEGKVSYDKTIMPINIISLEATDEFLHQRIMNLPEIAVAGTHNNEKDFNRRLLEHHANNTDEDSVLHYFDELEFHPEKIDVMEDKSENMVQTVEKIKKIIGPPRNYGMTVEESEEENRKQEEMKMQRETEHKEEKEKADATEAADRRRKQDEWVSRLEEVQREEQDLLETQSVPLRNYLMKHVMPSLTKGLVNCCKVRPDDPIDYLAEYLFKHNPQVD